jgi:hypothetical protein
MGSATFRINDTAESETRRIVDSGELIFDYEYLREFQVKIEKAAAIIKHGHWYVPLTSLLTAAATVLTTDLECKKTGDVP